MAMRLRVVVVVGHPSVMMAMIWIVIAIVRVVISVSVEIGRAHV